MRRVIIQYSRCGTHITVSLTNQINSENCQLCERKKYYIVVFRKYPLVFFFFFFERITTGYQSF